VQESLEPPGFCKSLDERWAMQILALNLETTKTNAELLLAGLKGL
jgi:hypothetical protein